MQNSKFFGLVIVASIIASPIFLVSGTQASGNSNELIKAPAVGTAGSFAFVSLFTSGNNYADYGWNEISGQGKPLIVNSPNYFGEPSLQLFGGQTLETNSNVTPGDQFVSFQLAVNAADGTGYFAIVNSDNQSIVSVVVSGYNIVVSSRASNTKVAGTVPQPNSYNDGWVYLSGNLYNSSKNNKYSWTFQVFVDETNSTFATVSAPLGPSYSGIQISSIAGKVYFTDIYFTSYEIPIYLPGYNNMEGYGQGSGLLVTLLPAFTILHANMIIDNWTSLQNGILSFQINAMNYYGATRSSCKGFFQLGVDLDPNGTIAPWYVSGTNCVAHYFLNSSNPAVQSGFYTPSGTNLGLTIEYFPQYKYIFFQIIDYSVTGSDRYWNATIPYNGTEFYATYTQLEFQSVAESSIMSYHFNGSLYNMTYGNSWDSLVPLNSSYMLPFVLDAPSTWSLTYYNGENSGYSQIA